MGYESSVAAVQQDDLYRDISIGMQGQTVVGCCAELDWEVLGGLLRPSIQTARSEQFQCFHGTQQYYPFAIFHQKPGWLQTDGSEWVCRQGLQQNAFRPDDTILQ